MAHCDGCFAELTAIQSKIFELGTTLEQLGSTSQTAVGGSCLNVTEVEFHAVQHSLENLCIFCLVITGLALTKGITCKLQYGINQSIKAHL